MTVFIFLGSLLGAMALGIPIAYSLLVEPHRECRRLVGVSQAGTADSAS